MSKASFPRRAARAPLLGLVATLAVGGCGSPPEPPMTPEASKAKINARESFAQETKGMKVDTGATGRASNRGRR